jgi:hypothetical protein
LSELLNKDEPVILTFYDIPLEWAWEIIPTNINNRVTIDVRQSG